MGFRRGRKVLVFGCVCGCVLSLLVGCSPEKKYRVLSFFFDGVPVPPGMEEAQAQTQPVVGPWGIKMDPNDPRAAEFVRAAAEANEPTQQPTTAEEPKIEYLHAPYRDRLCIECHAGSDSYQAPKAGAEVCAQCHATQSKTEVSDWVHGPVNSGDCLQCHLPHKSNYRSLLTMDQPALCFTCHDRAGVLEQAYHEQALEGLCTRCHDPHSAGNRLLLADSRSYRLRRFNADQTYSGHASWNKDDCARCHLVQQGNVLIENIDNACLSCHQKVVDAIPPGSTPAPGSPGSENETRAGIGSETENAGGPAVRPLSSVDAVAATARAVAATYPATLPATQPTTASGDWANLPAGPSWHQAIRKARCTQCHTPHKSVRPHLIKPAAEGLCVDCHKLEELPQPPHPKVTRVDCLLCHHGHQSERAKLLRAGIRVESIAAAPAPGSVPGSVPGSETEKARGPSVRPLSTTAPGSSPGSVPGSVATPESFPAHGSSPPTTAAATSPTTAKSETAPAVEQLGGDP
ncbi:MAG: hypothetical protein IT443_11505 [Phycisphaeraceae bacterium]|nr:hypothetical protein [Phycisphaeraceae bacterium]